MPLTAHGYKALGGCVDVNECDSTIGFLHFCGDDATCINTDGTYNCQCNTGFRSGRFLITSNYMVWDFPENGKPNKVPKEIAYPDISDYVINSIDNPNMMDFVCFNIDECEGRDQMF